MISIVVPCFNEEKALPALRDRLQTVAHEQLDGQFECICIDDGSTDSTLKLLREFHETDPRWKYVSLSRNFGHQAAVTAGLRASSGDIVCVIDADLQDPPEIIPQLVNKVREGFDVAYAVRASRREGLIKRTCYYLFYRVVWMTSGQLIPFDAGDFSAVSRRVVEILDMMPERNRFVRGLRSWSGFSQVAVPYERSARHAGQSKYSLSHLVKLALDGVFSFSYLPMRLATYVGLSVSSLSFLAVSFVFVQRIVGFRLFGVTPGDVPGMAFLSIALLFLGGVQLIMLGVMGEYLARIYDEVKGRPLYVCKELGGLAESAAFPGARAAVGGSGMTD